MNHQKPSLRRTIVAALIALGAVAVSVTSAKAAPGGQESPGDARLNIGLAITEKLPGYPF